MHHCHEAEFDRMLEQFLAYLKVEKGLAHNTILSYGGDLRQFYSYIKSLGINELGQIGREHVGKYCEIRAQNHASAKSLHRNLSSLRRFFWFLRKEAKIALDPTSDMDLPRVEKKLPRYAKIDEIDELIKQPRVNSARGMRDTAIIAMLYASGLRVSELIALKVSDLDLMAGFLRTIGKGKKERVIPLNERAMALVAHYLELARPLLLNGFLSDLVFIRKNGKRLSRQSVWKIIKKYAQLCGMKGDFSPHQLRHSFATHLLEGGVNLRALQLMLGHNDLATTEIYMHVDKTQLLALYDKHHPRSGIKYEPDL